ISHVIRGEDHVTNTAPQIELFRALGASVPQFAHFSLFVAKGGERLSKRLSSMSLRALKDEGIEPLALATYLAKMGTSDAIEPHASFGSLAAEFSFQKIGRAPAHFDLDELKTLNRKLIHGLSFAEVETRLRALGVGGGGEFWDAVRPNIERLSDAEPLWKMVSGSITPVIEDSELAKSAGDFLPDEPWDETTWGAWTSRLGASTGKKGRGLFHPLRLALTGIDHGPEMKKLLPLLGRARVLARLKGETA
ncbi:MAG: glutamate--tRNA ligase, partial [Alphaproteobacteria bacterium]|nr:glutamate--tRNA ligase [Alphaproteobacteria bacterium]